MPSLRCPGWCRPGAESLRALRRAVPLISSSRSPPRAREARKHRVKSAKIAPIPTARAGSPVASAAGARARSWAMVSVCIAGVRGARMLSVRPARLERHRRLKQTAEVLEPSVLPYPTPQHTLVTTVCHANSL